MKDLYKKIIFSVLTLGVTGGVIANNIYLNNKIEEYREELSSSITNQTLIYSSTDKKDFNKSSELLEKDFSETEITEEYINELIAKYYEQQEKRNILEKNSKLNDSRPIENQITYVTNEIKQIEECKLSSQVTCNHEFEFTKSSSVCPNVQTYYHTCKKCNYTYSSTDNNSIHNYEKIINDSRKNCTDKGILTKKCNTCDKTIEVAVEAIGHKGTKDNSYKYCSACGKKLSGIWNTVWSATLTYDSNCSAQADVYGPSDILWVGLNVDDNAWTTTANIKVIMENNISEEQSYFFEKDNGKYYNDFSSILDNGRVKKIEITNIIIKDKSGKILEENKTIHVNVNWPLKPPSDPTTPGSGNSGSGNTGNDTSGSNQGTSGGNSNSGSSGNTAEPTLSITSAKVNQEFTVTVNIPDNAVGYQGKIEVIFNDNQTLNSGTLVMLKEDTHPGNMTATFKALSPGIATIRVTDLLIVSKSSEQLNTKTELVQTINVEEETIPSTPSIPSTPPAIPVI